MDELAIHEACTAILGPGEVVKVAVPVDGSSHILAVISNVDDGEEEACVVKINDSASGSPSVTGLCPIYQDFDISLEQVDGAKHNVLEEVGRPLPATFRVTFSTPSSGHVVSAVTNDIARMQDLLKEAKRLTDIAEQHSFVPHGWSHTWINSYQARLAQEFDGSERLRNNDDSLGSSSRSIGSGSSGPPDSLSSLLSYGSRAIDGLPALTSTLSSFWKGTRGSPTKSRWPPIDSIFGAPKGPSQTGMALPPTTPSSTVKGTQNEVVLEHLDQPTMTKLRERKEEYTVMEDLKIHICTYNVNGKFCDANQDLSKWILPQEQPDLLVAGLQEMDLRPEVLMVRHDLAVGEAWSRAILSSLNQIDSSKNSQQSPHRYKEVASKQLAGLWIIAFAKEPLLRDGTISDVSLTSVMTGMAGFTGNKGACAIRLHLFQTPITFVCAHLAAFQDGTDRRNADFHDISKRAIFNIESDASPTGYRFAGIYDSGLTFFFGDLNYRLDHSMTGIQELIEQKKYTPLLAHDQLKLSQSASASFVGFEEGEINFQPTYKFDRGTDTYDSSEKERKPAWTDRILWRANDKTIKLKCSAYDSVMDIRASDHKPVYATFNLALPRLDRSKRSAVLAEIQKEDTKVL